MKAKLCKNKTKKGSAGLQFIYTIYHTIQHWTTDYVSNTKAMWETEKSFIYYCKKKKK